MVQRYSFLFYVALPILRIDLSIILQWCIVSSFMFYLEEIFVFLMGRALTFLFFFSGHAITFGFLLCKVMEVLADTKHQSLLFLSAKIFCSRLPQSEIGYSTKYLYRLFGLLPFMRLPSFLARKKAYSDDGHAGMTIKKSSDSSENKSLKKASESGNPE